MNWPDLYMRQSGEDPRAALTMSEGTLAGRWHNSPLKEELLSIASHESDISQINRVNAMDCMCIESMHKTKL